MKEENTRRHVKIVCTLGPASSAPEVISRLLSSGMNLARLNLSYGTPEQHDQLIEGVHSLSKQLKAPAAILLDLPGRKRRSGSTREVFGPQLDYALSRQVDFVALSFITSAQQVKEVRELMRSMKVDIPVIVKIEQSGALEESEAILELSDGIMVARGDLALEISIEKVPLAQKRLIREANRRGKPVITATQMLVSMVGAASPTRAEATDVANAVLDGSDALMLSEETAIGKYPGEAVAMMVKIIREAETALLANQSVSGSGSELLPETNDAAAHAACQIARQVQARAIVAFTTGGTTAWRVAKYRPSPPVLAVTPYENVVRRLCLAWGVLPVQKPAPPSMEAVFNVAREAALETGVAKAGDHIVITAGLPLAVSGNTNLVKVHQV